jgi:hypothetical protein
MPSSNSHRAHREAIKAAEKAVCSLGSKARRVCPKRSACTTVDAIGWGGGAQQAQRNSPGTLVSWATGHQAGSQCLQNCCEGVRLADPLRATEPGECAIRQHPPTLDITMHHRAWDDCTMCRRVRVGAAGRRCAARKRRSKGNLRCCNRLFWSPTAPPPGWGGKEGITDAWPAIRSRLHRSRPLLPRVLPTVW